MTLEELRKFVNDRTSVSSHFTLNNKDVIKLIDVISAQQRGLEAISASRNFPALAPLNPDIALTTIKDANERLSKI